MIKKFFIVFMALLFIGACGEKDSGTNDGPTTIQGPDTIQKPVNTQGPATQEPSSTTGEPGSTAVPASRPQPVFQECLTNLVNAIWRCNKENDVRFYEVKQESKTIDGTQLKICETKAKEGPSPYRPIYFARNNMTKCVEKLNQNINSRRQEGFTCRRTIYTPRSDMPANPC